MVVKRVYNSDIQYL